MKASLFLRILFYALWIFLGFSCGAGLYYWKHMTSTGDPVEQYIWGAAGIFLTLLLLHFISESAPDAIPNLLSRFRTATSGGWPWQQGRYWWVPFVLFLSPPLFMLVHFSSYSLYCVSLSSCSRVWFFVRLLLAYYDLVFFFALLLCYGTTFARKWTKAGAVIAIALAVCANVLTVLFAFFEPNVKKVTFNDAPAAVIYASVIPVFAVLSGVQVFFGLRLYRELTKAEPKPPPEPTASSPWRIWDLLVIVAVIPLGVFGLFLLAEHLFSSFGSQWLLHRYFLSISSLGVLFVVPFRRSIGSFLVGVKWNRYSVREWIKKAAPFFFFLLAAGICREPRLLMEWFSVKGLSSLINWFTISKAVTALIAVIGYECLVRGVAYEFFSRSFGEARTVVFLSLLCMGMSVFCYDHGIYQPGMIAFYLFLHFGLTFLRYSSGSVLACIVVRSALLVVMEPVYLELSHLLQAALF